MASLCLSAASSDTPIEIRLEKEASAESITMRDGRTDTKDKSKVEIRDERTNSFVQEKKKKGAKSQFHPPPVSTFLDDASGAIRRSNRRWRREGQLEASLNHGPPPRPNWRSRISKFLVTRFITCTGSAKKMVRRWEKFLPALAVLLDFSAWPCLGSA